MDDILKMPNLGKDILKVLVSEKELDEITSRLAREITEKFKAPAERGEKIVMTAVLNGAVIFFSDIIRKIDLPFEIAFMTASSYGKGATVSSGNVKIDMPRGFDVFRNAHVVILEDILDSGNTLSKVMEFIKTKDILSISLCALLDKPERRKTHVDVDFSGKVIPDEFVVGYGLDYSEMYRNLPYIGVLKPEIYNS